MRVGMQKLILISPSPSLLDSDIYLRKIKCSQTRVISLASTRGQQIAYRSLSHVLVQHTVQQMMKFLGELSSVSSFIATLDASVVN